MNKPKLYFIVGPTATGKTAAGVHLAKCLNGEIISADSMQIYRRMDIGTAKPSQAERAGIVHHMMDIVEPDASYSAAQFQQDAKKAIADVFSQGKAAIVVGGTGLYIDSLIKPLDFSVAPSDERIRKKWEDYLQEKGTQALHERLTEVDPGMASTLHPNNTRRIIRALEIYEISGKAMSAQSSLDEEEFELPYKPILVGLTMERSLLYERINQRVDAMLEQGLLAEIDGLLKAGLSPQAQSMKAIGYKELVPVLNHDMNLGDAVELLKRNSRRYAKRQWTWFMANKAIHWIDTQQYATSATLFDEILSYCLGNDTQK